MEEEREIEGTNFALTEALFSDEEERQLPRGFARARGVRKQW